MNISDKIRNNFNKSDWVQYKFSDFAENIVEKITPRESGLKHYIGLEHLDSGSLKINRFGDPQSLKGDKLKIYKGDIIFAKRNAYLKRASLSEFDAVASAHSMVLRAKPEIVLPEFLPFFMQSDSFWDVAIRISVGGLSPTINWKAMAKQEFLLPPKDQQEKIAELLWAMDEVVVKKKETLQHLDILNKTKLLDIDNINSKEYKIRDVMSIHYGKALKSSDRSDGIYSVVGSAGIVGTHNQSIVQGPGIVIGRKGNAGDVIWIENDFWPIDTAFYIDIKEDFNKIPLKFYYYIFKNLNLKRLTIATAVPGLNRDDVLLLKIKIPSQKIILDYLNHLAVIENSINELNKKLSKSKQLQKSLINEIFSS